MEIREDRVIVRATLTIPYNLTPNESDRIIAAILHFNYPMMDGRNIPFITEHRTIFAIVHKKEKNHIEFSIYPNDKDQFIETLTPKIKKIEKLMADAAYQKELLGYLDTGSYIRVINRLPKPQQDQSAQSITGIEDVMVELSKTGKLCEALSNVIKLLRMASGDLDNVGPLTMAEVITERSKPDYKKISESILDALGIRQV
jgi:hypothetical protein